MSPILHHVTTPDAWRSAQSAGEYAIPGPPTATFIHLCTPAQLPFVLDRHFPGQTGVLLLTIDATRLTNPLRYEISEPGQPPFPHLYGPLNLDAVMEVSGDHAIKN